MNRRPRFWGGAELAPLGTGLVFLLTPFSWAWRGLGWLRAWRAGRQTGAGVRLAPVICIGNAVLGGGGKTPLALWLAKVLQEPVSDGSTPCSRRAVAHCKVHYSARGYGGKIKRGAVVRVGVGGGVPDAIAHGDEVCLLARVAPVWVGRDRVRAIKQATKAGADLVLADDGLQNPYFDKDFSILCVQAGYGAGGFGNGRVFPAGPLRTTLAQALKASDAVFCYGENEKELESVKAVLAKYQFKGAVWHGQLVASAPAGVSPTAGAPTAGAPTAGAGNAVAFAGIAEPENFFRTCRMAGVHLVETVAFPDHHMYQGRDLTRLQALSDRHKATLLTTEKDAVRLPSGFATALPVRLETAHRQEILATLTKVLTIGREG